jgi:hypothetical protein
VYKVIECIKVDSESSLVERFSSETTERIISYTVSDKGDLPEGFKVELFARGYLGGSLNEEHNIPIALRVYENGAIQIVPDRKVISSEKVKIDPKVLLEKFQDLDLYPYIISEIFNYIKFNFGAFLIKDKLDATVAVTVEDSEITVSYRDLTKFDFSKLGKDSGYALEELSPFGGTLNFRDIVGDLLSVSYRQVNEKDSEVKITLNRSVSDLKSCALLIDITQMSSYMNPIGIALDLFSTSPDNVREDQLAVAFIILEILSNLNYHNFRGFNEIQLVQYKDVPFPLPVPMGYTI